MVFHFLVCRDSAGQQIWDVGYHSIDSPIEQLVRTISPVDRPRIDSKTSFLELHNTPLGKCRILRVDVSGSHKLQHGTPIVIAVSYTHLTLPTNREV